MLIAIAATIISCLSLSAVDGDTIKCNGQNMRIMGPGSPNKSGVDTPEIDNAKCAKEELFGRPLVWVRLRNGQTAGEVLLREGYAARWTPGYQPRWCE